jgi:iron complex outermembrane receptor protein
LQYKKTQDNTMKNSTFEQHGKPALSRFALTLTPVAAACMLLASAGANAQTATAPTGDTTAATQTITVSGIRRGIESAIAVKRDSTSIVESISAEDIGKLPDVSIAESISRLPGLAAQRVAGRAQVISVRGLSPDFSTTLLNGREQVSTGDNRSVEFDQYPSELMSGVTIYKTPDAGLVGQGLSGTIDMQTVRPLSFQTRTVAMSLRGEKNSLGSIANEKSTGNRFSISYIDQFANRTVGLALGFSHLDSPVLDNETGLYEPWKRDSRPGVPAGTYLMDGAKALATSGRNKRDGFIGVLQYRPSKEWTSVLDVYASRFHTEQTANQFEVNLGDYNGGFTPGLLYQNTTVANGVLTGGTATGVYPLVRGMYNNRKDDIQAAGWSNTFKMAEWTLFADINYSKAKRDEVSLENNTQISNAAGAPFLDALKVHFEPGMFAQLAGARNYADASQLYVRNTIYGSGYGKTPKVKDELSGFKVVASTSIDKYLGGTFSTLDVGLNYADRTKTKHQPEGNINLAGAATTIPSDLQYGLVDLGFAGAGMVPSWNVPAVVSRFMVFAPDEAQSYLIAKAWEVNEKITTGFFKANLDTQLGGLPLRGNIGVQVQRTDQSSDSRYGDGTATAGNNVKPVHDGKTYTDVLPSANLVFGLGDDQTLRFAAGRQLARARVDQLRSALDFNISSVDRRPSGSGGNAQLDPWRANAYDVSYEKYFGTKAYFSAAAYYKKLITYIYTQSVTHDFSQQTAGTVAITNLGQYTAPYNGKGGTMSGFELAASLPFNLLTPVLDGFGLTASATFNHSAITIPDTSGSIGSNIPLPGLSKRVSNLTLYYEKAGFEARVSQRRRSDFVGEISNFAAERTLRYVVGETVTDFQMGYSFKEGNLKGVSVVLQVNNLTNTPYETYADSPGRQLEYMKYGRTVLAGVSYKF